MLENKTSEQLEAELDSIEEQCDSLYDRREKILAEIRRRDEEAVGVTNSILSVGKGSIIVAAAKNDDYHQKYFVVYRIIDVGNIGFKCLVYTYRVDDSEYSFSVREDTIGKHTFHDMKEEFCLYSIPYGALIDLLDACVNLKITYENRRDYEKPLQSASYSSIRI